MRCTKQNRHGNNIFVSILSGPRSPPERSGATNWIWTEGKLIYFEGACEDTQTTCLNKESSVFLFRSSKSHFTYSLHEITACLGLHGNFSSRLFVFAHYPGTETFFSSESWTHKTNVALSTFSQLGPLKVNCGHNKHRQQFLCEMSVLSCCITQPFAGKSNHVGVLTECQLVAWTSAGQTSFWPRFFAFVSVFSLL